MGKKKQAKRVSKWIEKDDGVTFDDLVYAGLGVLGKSAAKGKKKRFKKAVTRGEALATAGIDSLDRLLAPEIEDPVISYAHSGGGWFTVDIGGVIVDTVQGEEAAASRAGELLEGYAALDSDKQDPARYGIYDSGGGWYEIVVHGVPVARIQGQESAEEFFAGLESASQPDS